MVTTLYCLYYDYSPPPPPPFFNLPSLYVEYSFIAVLGCLPHAGNKRDKRNITMHYNVGKCVYSLDRPVKHVHVGTNDIVTQLSYLP